jgi:membrane-bound inhibitor of C-type lysozyme
MSMRFVLPALALMSLALASCGDPNTPQPAPPDPPAQSAAPPAPDTPDVEATYDCSPVMAVSVRYNNTADPPGATVTVDGRVFEMAPSISGSGARYMTETGRSAGMTLVWWNKGNEGTLFEGKSADPDAEETVITRCTEKAR